jgi:hypothetical protein
LADDGDHEVDDAGDSTVLLLEGNIEVVSHPSLLFLYRVGRRRRSGVVPSMGAPFRDS